MIYTKAFQNSRVSKSSIVSFSTGFMQTFQNCDNFEAMKDLLDCAFMMELPNRWEMEDLFFERFPLNLKSRRNEPANS